MLYNTTHHNKKDIEAINNTLGKPYSFIRAIKLKGTGSKRMIISAVSPRFLNILNTVSDANYGNIELREKGILVHITKGLKNYSWAIPYYQLHIYNTDNFSIHAQGNFVSFKKTSYTQKIKNL
jgi:hypothetical protein